YHIPYTIYHIPYTIYHIPYTIYHIPYTIHHTPYTLHRTPYTIHHTTSIHHSSASAAAYEQLPSHTGLRDTFDWHEMKLMIVFVLLSIFSFTFSFRAHHRSSAIWSQICRQEIASLSRLFAGKASRSGSTKIRVQLLADVKDVGKKGEILMINPAVYKNVLQIKKLAKKISEEELANMEAEKKRKLLTILTTAEAYAMQLKTIVLTIYKKMGSNNQLFGSVSQKHVLEEIKLLAPNSMVDWTTRGVGIEDICEDMGDGKRGNVVKDIRKGGRFVVRVRMHAEIEPVHIPLSIVPQK
ncbi:hypothetical protein EON63_22195, partial [archaeon]